MEDVRDTYELTYEMTFKINEANSHLNYMLFSFLLVLKAELITLLMLMRCYD